MSGTRASIEIQKNPLSLLCSFEGRAVTLDTEYCFHQILKYAQLDAQDGLSCSHWFDLCISCRK